MRKELRQIEQVEAYVLGTLTTAEHADFEMKMHGDKALRQLVESQKQLTQRLARVQMMAALHEVHQDWISSKGLNGAGGKSGGSRWSGSLNIFFIFALCTIAIMGIWLSLKETPIVTIGIPSSQQVASSYPEPNVEVNGSLGFVDSTEALITQDTAVYSSSATLYSPPKKMGNIPPLHSIPRVEQAQKPNKAVALIDRKYFKPSTPSDALTEQFIIAGENGALLTTKSGTQIDIGANAFRNPEGNIAQGPVNIVYTEYRTKGDMVLGKIPMHWMEIVDGDTTIQQFSSVGMFSLTAFSDSTELSISQYKGGGITVNFSLNDTLAGTNFFYFDEEKQEWEIAGDMDLTDNALSGIFGDQGKGTIEKTGGGLLEKRRGFFGRLWEWIRKGSVNGKTDARLKSVFTETKKKSGIGQDVPMVYQNIALRQQMTLYRLGTYNYDRLIKQPTTVVADITPIDEDGQEILDMWRLAVIDPNLNGAYQYPQRRLYLTPEVNYSIFLFDQAGNIYYCSAQVFKDAAVLSHGNYKLVFRDVTHTIKEPKDIDRILEQDTLALTVNNRKSKR